MKLTEKQIEDVFERFHEELIENGLKLIDRQYRLKNNLRVDLLFIDKNKKNVVVELKRDTITREDIGQLLQYAGTIENSRVILIAPVVPSSIKKAFEHYGIEYLEFSINKIEKLLHTIEENEHIEYSKCNSKINILKDIIKEPLSLRKLRDGNIVFKIVYNDKNWEGICSKDIHYNNAYSKEKKVWCSIQEDSCQGYADDDLDMDYFPCYDSIALLNLGFSPGWNHGQNRPYVCHEAKTGKIALFTSRKPGDEEKDRFIFAIILIDRIVKVEESKLKYPHEFYYGSKKHSIVLNPKNYINFWEYYSNPNAPDVIAWGSGLFRYIKDKTIKNILDHIIITDIFSNAIKNKARFLITKYE